MHAGFGWLRIGVLDVYYQSQKHNAELCDLMIAMDKHRMVKELINPKSSQWARQGIHTSRDTWFRNDIVGVITAGHPGVEVFLISECRCCIRK